MNYFYYYYFIFSKILNISVITFMFLIFNVVKNDEYLK